MAEMPYRIALIVYLIRFDLFLASSSSTTYKIMLVGESEVGKTAIMERFCTGQFPKEHVPIPTNVPFTNEKENFIVNDSPFTVELCDMPSANEEERFLDSFYSIGPKMDAIIMVYDVGNRSSFGQIPHHFRKMKEILMKHNGGVEDLSKEPLFMLVGNKCDLANDERKVSRKGGKRLAMLFDMPFKEVSAYKNINIDSMFITLVKPIKEKKAKKASDKFIKQTEKIATFAWEHREIIANVASVIFKAATS